MNFLEFQKRAAALPETAGLKLERALIWMHPELLPLGVVSLTNKNEKSVKIPDSAVNEYGFRVRIIKFQSKTFAGNEEIEEVILPPGIWNVPAGAFEGCKNLKRITLPRKIGEIGEGAFRGCETLEDVYYEGTPEDWIERKIVHQKHEIEFGELLPGSPAAEILAERWVPIPGNEALFQATLHFRCDLASLYPEA